MSEVRKNDWVEFRARPSNGRWWTGGIGAFLLIVLVGPFIATWGQISPLISGAFTFCGLIIAGPIMLAAWYYPTMRYWVGPDELVLSFGPLMNDRIPIDAIRSIRRRTLRMAPMAAFRFPGLAIFFADYLGADRVRMCATSASKRILLIDTGARKYGITPDDEYAFVDAIVARSDGGIVVSENFSPARRAETLKL